jgi:hypothetical protein
MEGLLMEIFSIVVQHSLIPLYPVMKIEFQFRPLNFTQKFLNASDKILWPGALLLCQGCLPVPEKPEIKRQKMPSQDCKADGVPESYIFQRVVL